MKIPFFFCQACNAPVSLKKYPCLCESCQDALILCPKLCSICGEMDCLTKSECLRPWRKSDTIEFYESQYLCSLRGYRVLRSWKNRSGLLFDRVILNWSSDRTQRLRDFAPDCIVPIPQSTRRARMLRSNPAEEISISLARQIRKPLVHALFKESSIRQSSLHTLDERAHHRMGFRTILEKPNGIRRALIVDDLMTTGNTLRQASEALNSGWGGRLRIGICVLGVRHLRRRTE